MATDAVVVASTEAYQRGLDILAGELGSTLADAFGKRMAAGLTDRVDVLEWVENIQPAVMAAAIEAAGLAGAHSMTVGSAPSASATSSVMYAQLAPFDGPYLRLWRGLGDGLMFEDAAADAAEVAGQLSASVVQHVSRRSTGTAGRFRRVLTLSSCKWCAVVSTQLYHSAESATFGHNNCDCTVVPVHDSASDAAIDELQRQRLSQLKADGVIDEISDSRAWSRIGSSTVRAAEHRDQLLNMLASESDPARRQRLRKRARSWNDRIAKANAAAAEKAAGI